MKIASILHHEPIIRTFFFLTTLLMMIALESLIPKRSQYVVRKVRRINNLLLIVVNTFLLRLIFPMLAFGLAIYAEKHHAGLFYALHLPYWLNTLLTIIILDFVIYKQHVYFHRHKFFWRIHRMHHTDLDVDTTTGLRFHPAEIMLSMAIKMAVVITLGVSPLGIVMFEILLNMTSLFNHANISILAWLDWIIRWFIVTPDMHRVHHSIMVKETNSNFGFNLSCWDRLFKTYIKQPEMGHQQMTLGLPIYRDEKYLQLHWLLLIPLLK